MTICRVLQDGTETVIDADDFERLKNWSAWKSSHGYVRIRRRGSGRPGEERYLHRFIVRAPKGTIVDHVNGDRLDNRKANLRITNATGNARSQRGLRRNNTSGFRGVSWFIPAGKWRATIKVNRRQLSLGYFDDPIEAARAYNVAAKRHHGRFASLNELP